VATVFAARTPANTRYFDGLPELPLGELKRLVQLGYADAVAWANPRAPGRWALGNPGTYLGITRGPRHVDPIRVACVERRCSESRSTSPGRTG
jgi:hypothetical protein